MTVYRVSGFWCFPDFIFEKGFSWKCFWLLNYFKLIFWSKFLIYSHFIIIVILYCPIISLSKFLLFIFPPVIIWLVLWVEVFCQILVEIHIFLKEEIFSAYLHRCIFGLRIEPWIRHQAFISLFTMWNSIGSVVQNIFRFGDCLLIILSWGFYSNQYFQLGFITLGLSFVPRDVHSVCPLWQTVLFTIL